ncbi:iron assimilation by reduction and transport [Mactra antiquata]
MGILLNNSFSHIPPPPYGFPECRSFSANKEPPRETTEAPTTVVTTTDVTNSAQGVEAHVTQCNMDSPSCEIFLELEHWMTMRKEYGQKVYINVTDGKIYQYNDDTNTEIDPHDVVLADGSDHDKVIAVFNRTMPGPTLVVYKNQEVTIHVRNLMLSDAVAVHFHGIEMRGTPWMDGASFVTQCPIMSCQ